MASGRLGRLTESACIAEGFGVHVAGIGFRHRNQRVRLCVRLPVKQHRLDKAEYGILAPTPRVRVSTATKVKAELLRSVRREERRSGSNVNIWLRGFPAFILSCSLPARKHRKVPSHNAAQLRDRPWSRVLRE
jgi:hypothetical protein